MSDASETGTGFLVYRFLAPIFGKCVIDITLERENCMGMGTAGKPRYRANTAVMGTKLAVIPRDGDRLCGNTVGMGTNGTVILRKWGQNVYMQLR